LWAPFTDSSSTTSAARFWARRSDIVTWLADRHVEGIGSRGANLPSITCDSLALCSAPYKALRFAPPRSRGPSGLDGACAQRTSRLLRDGR